VKRLTQTIDDLRRATALTEKQTVAVKEESCKFI